MHPADNDKRLADNELLRGWHAGDKSMGSSLFHRHFTSVQRFFRNKVIAEDIEDLVQQTFLGCLESIARFRGEATFRTYLFAIARRRLYSYLRARDVCQRRTEPDLSITSICDLGMTPSSVVAAAREHIIMLQALQRLSVERQTLLELFYWEDLRGHEIAEVLDIPPATVRTRLFRARTELKEILEGMQQEQGISQSVDIEDYLRATGASQ
ncbi:MAG: RNA polymerase sigma factor [Nannocystaceae bacterium]|nr:RNA polymerase sigma factor [Nannocystaceae bacterium]